MAARNNVCGVGIAWESKISGLRILSGPLSRADEAASVNYKFHENHIYSCSWGPNGNPLFYSTVVKMTDVLWKHQTISWKQLTKTVLKREEMDWALFMSWLQEMAVRMMITALLTDTPL